MKFQKDASKDGANTTTVLYISQRVGILANIGLNRNHINMDTFLQYIQSWWRTIVGILTTVHQDHGATQQGRTESGNIVPSLSVMMKVDI